ncbi:MAG TPA: glycosyltransferase family 4 protein [Planctomycetaceae bacterium]|jgi:glycosyltransferase involved in cell wall biosynthesis|nr:glycosyltransferase family 4 protein [Planctomycetaceae bacterium]
MLAILTSHPIQYQVPIWQALAASGAIPFEVWYLTDHGVKPSRDVEFGKRFAWDLDLLSGYRHQFLKVDDDWDLKRFRGIRLRENLTERLHSQRVRALWIEGWRFSAFWKAVGAAKRNGVNVWMRGDSNDLKRERLWKRLPKRTILGRHLKRVDRFLCVGSANRRLYESYGIGRSKLISTPHCVDNDRFAEQAAESRRGRNDLRAKWRIPPNAFCFLFCGSFINLKRPLDLVEATKQLMQASGSQSPVHLLFVGGGQLGAELRRQCRVAFDADASAAVDGSQGTKAACGSVPREGATAEEPSGSGAFPPIPDASFAGFLNQSEIASAYAAADAIVLPSESETWGLVVNEAMACGIPAVVSDHCGCAEDLPARVDKRLVFRCGDIDDLARAMGIALNAKTPSEDIANAVDAHHLRHTVRAIEELYRELTLATLQK